MYIKLRLYVDQLQVFSIGKRGLFFIILLSFFYANAEIQITPDHLSRETVTRFEKVPEFAFIIQEAEKLGVKVYLFGGTASAFAHYVRWDLEREAGDDKYQDERFDYDFTNIYRGNQDLDIVVDGSPEQADQLKDVLQKTYPHFVGDREAWEVRLLRQSRGDKRALIGDEDFKKQHSDTNSTGMLLLNPDEGGIVYNDLLNWDSPESDFLNDVAAARIQFLFGKGHKETQRFKDGRNPPVLAAIRYLAKLAQYEVTGTEEDLEIVTQIIAETDFTKLSDYGKKKAEEFALKTLLNAPDSEYAWNLLDQTGAREKLIEMDGERLQVLDSLSWWMNKELLRSYDLGTKGKTAREIFGTDEIIVSHETNSFKAYDNITRSSKGGANAFISREGVVGEAAQYGDGFYTKIGQEGARDTGLTIRFKLHPEAREGVDFEKAHDFIIVKNKNALTLIQENLNISVLDFLKLFVGGDVNNNDKGLLAKFERKFARVIDLQKEIENIEEELFIGQNFPLKYRFNYRMFDKFSDLLRAYVHFVNEDFLRIFGADDEFWQNNKKTALAILDLYNSKYDELLVKIVLFKGYDWVDYDLIDRLLKEERAESEIIKSILSQKKWTQHIEWIEHFIKKEKFETEDLIKYVIAPHHVETHPELIDSLLKKTSLSTVSSLIKYVFSKEEYIGFSKKWIDQLLAENYAPLTKAIINSILSQEHSARYPEWVTTLIEEGSYNEELDKHVFSKKHWKDHPLFMHYIQKRFSFNVTPRVSLSHNPFTSFALSPFVTPVLTVSTDDPEKISTAKINVTPSTADPNYGDIRRPFHVVENILSKELWAQHPQGFELAMVYYELNILWTHRDIRQEVFANIFSKPAWVDHEGVLELIKKEIRRGKTKVLKFLVANIFTHPHWLKSEKAMELLEMLLDKVSGFSAHYRVAFHTNDGDASSNFFKKQHLYKQIERHIFADVTFVSHPRYFQIMSKLIKKSKGQMRRYLIEGLGTHAAQEHPRWLELAKLVILNTSPRYYKLIEEHIVLKLSFEVLGKLGSIKAAEIKKILQQQEKQMKKVKRKGILRCDQLLELRGLL